MTRTKKPVLYWSRNTAITDDPKVNLTFEELLLLPEDKLTEWLDFMRNRVREVWDTTNCPPKQGKSPKDMAVQSNRMQVFNTSQMLHVDQLTGNRSVIIDDARLGSWVDQFFPTMMKVRIDYSDDPTKDSAKSIYDYFALDKLKETFFKGERRHLRRDSFYNYSATVSAGEPGDLGSETGLEWVRAFKRSTKRFNDKNFWLCESVPKAGASQTTNTGYGQQDLTKILSLSADEVRQAIKERTVLPRHLTNIPDVNNLKPEAKYIIRVFNKTDRIFPLGFMGFRIGYVQSAVNFPALVAKFLYEHFLKHIPEKQSRVVVFDPSSGWGGRIAGAMNVNDREGDRTLHYVGTDPNPDNWPTPEYSRYHAVADFINSHRPASLYPHSHTFEVFSSGSEDLHKLDAFKKYKKPGFDFIFTSPPYFNRERYSEDENQSFKKFPAYEDWCENFLRPTLKTCAEYLRHDRYLAWNIADVKTTSGYLPLQEDSKRILAEYGLVFKETLHLALVNMPGANRIGEDGKPTAKNYVQVDGKYRKTEPILIFYKP